MSSLRELLLDIVIKADKSGIDQTDAAIRKATADVGAFERNAGRAVTAQTQQFRMLGAEIRRSLSFTQQLGAALRGVGARSAGMWAENPLAAQWTPVQQGAEGLAVSDAATIASASLDYRKRQEELRGPQTLLGNDIRERPADRRRRFAESVLDRPSEGSPLLRKPDLRALPTRGGGIFDEIKAKAADARFAFDRAKASLSNFSGAFPTAQRSSVSFAGALSGARLAAIGFASAIAGSAIKGFIDDVISLGSSLHDTSKRTRLSVETLQAWGTVAEEAGADAGAVESAFRKLSRAVTQANKAGKASPMSKAFKDLGVVTQGRELEDVMIDVGTALSVLDDDAKSTALAVQLLGPAGAALIPAFEGGSDAIRAQVAEMKKHVVLTAKEAEALDELDDELGRTAKTWKAVKAQIVLSALPAIRAATEAFQSALKWIRETNKHSNALGVIWAGIAAGAGMKLLGMLRALLPVVNTNATGMARFFAVLRTGLAAFSAYLAPILAVTAALLAIEDVVTFLQGGKSLTGRFFEEILGPGGADAARDKIREFGTVLTEEILPKVSAVAREFAAFFASGAGSILLETLRLIGFALEDDAKKSEDMMSRFLKGANSIENAIDTLIKKFGTLFAIIAPGFALITKLTGSSAWTDGKAETHIPTDAEVRKENMRALGTDSAASLNLTAGTRAGMPFMPAGVAMPALPASAAAPNNKTIQLTDNRKVEVSVTSATPGATGRAVAESVSETMSVDRRQIMSSLEQ